MEFSDRYDLVVYGASSYTGQFVVEYVVREVQKDQTLTWAVAGRSKEKLETVVKQAAEYLGTELTDVPIIIADVFDEDSLVEMAKQSKVILNCVGPYLLYGEQLVKVCVENGTNHIDLSGEAQFLEKMQIEYHDRARENGVYVVGACGSDSIPTDMGYVYLKNKFDGDLNSAESFIFIDENGLTGSFVNIGTYKSVVHSFGSMRESKRIHRKLFPQPLPKPQHALKKTLCLHYNRFAGGWCFPFIGADPSCVERTQRYFYEQEKERPVQHFCYVKFNSLSHTLGIMCILSVTGLLALCRWGRRLLIRHPRFFTAGKIDDRELNSGREDNEKTSFTVTIRGSGWSDKADTHAEIPDKTMTVRVHGKNCGYGSACVCMVQAALTILRESDKMPGKGGVYSPGAAFAKTTLIDRLHSNGVTFEVLN